MTIRVLLFGIMVTALLSTTLSAQDTKQLLQQAQTFLERSDYNMVAELLTKALDQIHSLMLADLKSSFPNAPDGWRADDATGNITSNGREQGLVVSRSYYRTGGGSSIDIKVETNALRTGNLRELIMSPAKLQRVDATMTITTVGDRRCLERYDPVDKYGELTFVPTTSLIVTFKAFDSQDNKLIVQLAKQLNWTMLETRFP